MPKATAKTTSKAPAKAASKTPAPSVKELLAELKSLGDEKVRARHIRDGSGENVFGVQMGEIRKIAKRLKSNHELALELWRTGNLDARLLALLLMKPKELSAGELDGLVRDARFAWLANWLSSYIVRQHPEKESLREKWMKDKDPWAARAGWDLTAERVGKDAEGLDLPALLNRIEAEMKTADPAEQWTMNNTLATIGIRHEKLRKRAVQIGEKLGVYKDYPCSKGCTSPYAPEWIAEMVRRQG